MGNWVAFQNGQIKKNIIKFKSLLGILSCDLFIVLSFHIWNEIWNYSSIISYTEYHYLYFSHPIYWISIYCKHPLNYKYMVTILSLQNTDSAQHSWESSSWIVCINWYLLDNTRRVEINFKKLHICFVQSGPFSSLSLPHTNTLWPNKLPGKLQASILLCQN